MSEKTSPADAGRRLLNGGSRPWHAVRSWVCWLNGPDLAAIARTNCDLAVIDYSADASAHGEFGPADIERLRRSDAGKRVVAYLSVGEAERHRYYWQPEWRPGHPRWIVAENPDWPGDHLIEYWDPAWRATVLRYLDRIVAQDFDGVYLDWVDAYTNPHASGHETEMVDLILHIARYARRRSRRGKDFGVFAHNAEGLTTRHPRLAAALSGILREEVYVAATDQETPESERVIVEAELARFLASSAGKLVLTIDYANRPALVAEACSRARAQGFVPYVAGVALDRLAPDLAASGVTELDRWDAAHHR